MRWALRNLRCRPELVWLQHPFARVALQHLELGRLRATSRGTHAASGCARPRATVAKGLAGSLELARLAGEGLPALHCDIDVDRIDLQRIGATPGLLRPNVRGD